MKVLVALVLSCFLAIPAYAGEEAMSKQLVFIHAFDWWHKVSDEPVDLDIEEFEQVGLRGGEVAYLGIADFGLTRPPNFMESAILFRPRLQEAREIVGLIKRFHVEDLNEDGVSEIIANEHSGGQGQYDEVHTIVQFDGWTPIILHEALKEDFDGTGDPELMKNNIDFYRGFNSNGTAICMEFITYKGDPGVQTSQAAFLFRGTKFVPMSFNECSRWHLLKCEKNDNSKVINADHVTSCDGFGALAEAYKEVVTKPTLTYESRTTIEREEKYVQEGHKTKEKLLQTYSRALDKAPWWPTGYFRRAQLHAEMEQYDAAVADMERYLMLEPEGENATVAKESIAAWHTKRPQ